MSRPATSSWHWLRSEEQPSSRRRLSVVVVGGGSFVVGCSQNSLTSSFGCLYEEYPQVKEASTHSRSEALSPSCRPYSAGWKNPPDRQRRDEPPGSRRQPDRSGSRASCPTSGTRYPHRCSRASSPRRSAPRPRLWVSSRGSPTESPVSRSSPAEPLRTIRTDAARSRSAATPPPRCCRVRSGWRPHRFRWPCCVPEPGRLAGSEAIPQRTPRRSRPGRGLRARVRVRTDDGQPRRDHRAALGAPARVARRGPSSDPVVDRAWAARGGRHRVRGAPRGSTDRSGAPSDQAAGATGLAGEPEEALRRDGRLRVRKRGRDADDPSRERTLNALARRTCGRAARAAALRRA